MRKCFLILILWCSCMCTYAQCDSADYVSRYTGDSLLLPELDKWHTTSFYPLIKKHGVRKINCDKCTGVYVDLTFTVNEDGSIKPIRVNQARLCQSEVSDTFVRNFYNSLKTIKVPVQFAGRCFKYRFGRVLKC